MWFKRAFLGCTAALLLWAFYDYGAFLRPSKLVAAIVFPALGLAWGAWGLCRALRRSRSRRVEERQLAS
ncbi:MAG: hypothetical protein JW990_04355, partial [Thermoleophilia bacterium]|nr:hypothetical protein [Thermoleophilia bacterium]